jgi:dTDP-glucose pyrophosphorylase
VYLFQPVVFDAIRRTPRTAMRNEYELTESIEIMIRDGRDVRVSLSIEDDLNVTHPADLLAANLRVLEYEGLERYVANTAQVANGAKLDRAVVGGGASVGEGAVVRNCVVFGGAGVAAGERLEDAVVTESGVFKV